MTLKLNGEETRTQIGGGQGGGSAATVTSRAVWEGSKLVVTSAITGGRGGRARREQAYSLSGDDADARDEQLAARWIDDARPDRRRT